jgi:hypothetical protein
MCCTKHLPSTLGCRILFLNFVRSLPFVLYTLLAATSYWPQRLTAERTKSNAACGNPLFIAYDQHAIYSEQCVMLRRMKHYETDAPRANLSTAALERRPGQCTWGTWHILHSAFFTYKKNLRSAPIRPLWIFFHRMRFFATIYWALHIVTFRGILVMFYIFTTQSVYSAYSAYSAHATWFILFHIHILHLNDVTLICLPGYEFSSDLEELPQGADDPVDNDPLPQIGQPIVQQHPQAFDFSNFVRICGRSTTSIFSIVRQHYCPLDRFRLQWTCRTCKEAKYFSYSTYFAYKLWIDKLFLG